jgi:D-alanyl-D-alanine carboxypeptidase
MARNFFNVLVVFLTLSTIFSCSKSNEYESSANLQIQSNLQAMVDKTLSDYKIKYPAYPGGLAVQVISKNGSFFVSAGLGAGVTDKIHFRAASNSKTFTSAAIILLAQEGKLNVDAKIIDLIPGTNTTYVPLTANYKIPFRDQITIRMLLQHNAGVFDISNEVVPDTVSIKVPYKGTDYIGYTQTKDPVHTFTFDELVGVVSTCRLYYFAPGQSHHYSNTGYSILGKIIERVSGQSYSQFVTERIIKPMELSESSLPFSGEDQLLPAPFAKGYYFTPEVIECTKSNISANVAEGTLVTTPENLARFLRKLLRGEGVLKSYWVNNVLLSIPKTPVDAGPYACGIFYTENLGWGHNGAHEGFLSRMVSDPNIDITVVTFTNTWNIKDGMDTMREQLNLMLEETCYNSKYIVQ